MQKMRLRLAAAATLLALAVPATAQGAYLWVWENQGVRDARLTQAASYAVRLLGPYVRRDVDSNYSYLVYRYSYGTKMSDGRYPLYVYAKKWGDGVFRVFQFTVNSSAYVTRKGIRVGATETSLKTQYGAALRRTAGSTYTRYQLNSGKYHTVFYVRNSTHRVYQIVVGYW